MAYTVKEVASSYISSLVIACWDADKNSPEYHDAKAALEDLQGLISAVGKMSSSTDTELIAHYCTKYQQEALETC